MQVAWCSEMLRLRIRQPDSDSSYSGTRGLGRVSRRIVSQAVERNAAENGLRSQKHRQNNRNSSRAKMPHFVS